LSRAGAGGRVFANGVPEGKALVWQGIEKFFRTANVVRGMRGGTWKCPGETVAIVTVQIRIS